ncbi:DUF5691 domain-containing protein [Planctomicrobium sp.]|nr:DUF5691 domain-containing protein [Planctomicrobium sp.]MBT5019468.1 hypothetical protein [Planctomicrobium sp.]MDB4743063.1 DUF5691 domain-containing protein [Planctomicrobium sp.]
MLSDQLLKVALVGTAQAPQVPINSENDVDSLIGPSIELSIESQFLLRAGRLAIYQRAGQLPVTVPQVDTFPSKERVEYSDSFLKLFETALTKEQHVLLPEFLSLLASRKLFAPDKYIPRLLDLEDLTVRPLIQAVVGAKGEWLSQFNPNWNWTVSDPTLGSSDLEGHQGLWDDGTFPERLAALRAIRKLNPELGRELLAEVFTKEKVENRKQLLAAINEELGPEDIEFLTLCLSDRSKYVRQQAANLLAKIPNSEVSQRNRMRANNILTQSDSNNASKLVCQPPQELPTGWEEDGLEVNPPNKRGQRAFWTEELISKIPLQHWESQFSATPVELINGILNDDYAHAVITGWSKAISGKIVTSEFQGWLNSLWKYWSAMLQHPQQAVVIQALEQLGGLARKMSSTDLDRQLLQLLRDQHDPAQLPVNEILKWIPTTWSKSFSHEYLRISRTLAGSRSDKAVYEWLQSTAQAAVFLSPDLFAAALTPWKIRDHGVQAWQVAGIEILITNFQERIQLRASFYNEIKLAGVD